MQQLDIRLDPTWDQNKRRNDHDLLESLIGTAALSTSAPGPASFGGPWAMYRRCDPVPGRG